METEQKGTQETPAHSTLIKNQTKKLKGIIMEIEYQLHTNSFVIRCSKTDLSMLQKALTLKKRLIALLAGQDLSVIWDMLHNLEVECIGALEDAEKI